MNKSPKTEVLKALDTLERSVEVASMYFEHKEQLDAFDAMSDAELEQYLVSGPNGESTSAVEVFSGQEVRFVASANQHASTAADINSALARHPPPASWSSGLMLAADKQDVSPQTPEVPKTVKKREIHEFASFTLEQGEVAFLDDGAAVYVRIVASEPARQITLGNSTYDLDVSLTDASLLYVIGLLPAEAARFVRKHKQSPAAHSISWVARHGSPGG